jgi:small subunit ribosomal protein S4e
MGKKGPTRHIKRHYSPDFWPINRKLRTWTIRPSPGPHKLRKSIPLEIILRDYLNYASTGREAKFLIKKGKVLIDQRVRKDEDFPVGLMDVLSLPDSEEYFRILPEHGGRFILHKVSKEESIFKLCRVEGKTTVKGGFTQINLHDGRNIIITPEEDRYDIYDVLKIKIPQTDMLDIIPLKENVQVIVTGGNSQGERGILMRIGSEAGRNKLVDVKTRRGEEIRTLIKYIFAIGIENPQISLPEPSEVLYG